MARLNDAQLIRAAAHNHASWFRATATVAGGRVMRSAGLAWVAPPPGGEAILPFPRRASRPALDAMLGWCRRHDVAGIGCWTTGLESTTELAARLVARGFEWGWQAHWMAIDLDALPLGHTDPRVSLATEVPEYGGHGRRMLALTSGRFWHAVAREDGAYAGRAWAHVTGGKLGCAGIYDVDVAPRARGRGLGRALTLAVCRAAAAAGARTATLNATGEGELLYGALGFRSLGHGQKWWIHRDGLAARQRPALVRVAEAVGRGDVAALARLDPRPALLRARLAGNRLTLPQVALAAGQHTTADWLVARGAELDAVTAWDLGGQRRLRALLQERPDALEALAKSEGATLAHVAVERADVGLLRLAIDLGVDLARRDSVYGGTPLDWARHLGNADCERLLADARGPSRNETTR
jgi:GNAT superfamily N-acetyltransferase